MWFWIILVAVVFIGGIVISIRERDDAFFILGLIGMLVAGVVGGMFCCGIGAFFEADEVYDVDHTEIVALADNTGAQGSFFLGSGTVKSDIYYFYITENEDGSKDINKIRSRDVAFYDDEADAPYIVTIRSHNSSPVARFFFITEECRTEVHIPPNSITSDFSVDLQ